VETGVNSCPLVYVDNDIKSSLTHSDFLLINPNNVIQRCSRNNQDADYEKTSEQSTASKLLDAWKYGQRNLDYFWGLWRTEYLLSLRERAQTQLRVYNKQVSNTPKVGDVVSIKDKLP